MDEISKIYLKTAALIKARNYLLNRTPSDMVAIAEITENIVDLTGSRLAAVNIKQVPDLSADEQVLLRQALGALDNSIAANASRDEILERAKGVYDFVPWPPKDPKFTLPDLKDWPGNFDDIARWPP